MSNENTSNNENISNPTDMKRIISASNADGEYIPAPKVTLGSDATNMNETFETDRDSIYGSPTASMLSYI